MARNRTDAARYREIASALGVSESEVRNIVSSFFGGIVGYARTLPFNNPTRIYTADKFEEYVRVWNIPSIGRMGLSYGRYLSWRGNEARLSCQMDRSAFLERKRRDEIETIADVVLSGGAYCPERKTKKETYKRVWLVGKGGKRLARQALPKEEKDV